ncbi:Mur ligase [candidate division KSB1 bacterium]|nr:Mur ligase [candidate division KSB1 bacterium]
MTEPGKKLEIQDSRRLTGANLLSNEAGAILDVTISGYPIDEVVHLWQQQALHLLEGIGWIKEQIFFRVFNQGASLSLSAPVDALYAATEVNEAAWNSAVANLQREDVVDYNLTVDQLKKTIDAEQNPDLIRLMDASQERGVCFLSDDETVSIGMGIGSKTWEVDEIPHPDKISWHKIHDIPLALVTGTNGKSTTVRLLASMLKSAGKIAGITSTDYIRVGEEIIDSGDYSGPGGARTLLRDDRVEVGVLEVARGGILRRGLGVPKADTAIVTNVAVDHLGQYGIDTLDDLIQAKLVVNRSLNSNGKLVLNADDEGIVRHAKTVKTPICWFSLDENNPVIIDHLNNGGCVCTIKDNQMIYQSISGQEKIVPINNIPIAMNGASKHNTANCLGAIGLAKSLQINRFAIVEGLTSFRGDLKDNPGRGNLFEINGAKIMIDFAHNVHGMSAIVDTVSSIPAHRRLLLMGQAGDRTDEEIRALTQIAWQIHPDRIVLTDLPVYLRGREEGEVPMIIQKELIRLGSSAASIILTKTPLDGVKEAIDWAQEGDLLLLLILAQRNEVFEYLNSRLTN